MGWYKASESKNEHVIQNIQAHHTKMRFLLLHHLRLIIRKCVTESCYFLIH